MADVFVSYDREDVVRARALAEALTTQGRLVEVTFDRDVRTPLLFRPLNVIHLTSTDLSGRTSRPLGFLADIDRLTGRHPDGGDPALIERAGTQRSSDACLDAPDTAKCTLRGRRGAHLERVRG